MVALFSRVSFVLRRMYADAFDASLIPAVKKARTSSRYATECTNVHLA